MYNPLSTDQYGRNISAFPSGIEISDYPISWTYREWAWQFLRRREDYIKSCHEISNCKKPAAKQALIKAHCDNFKLKKYISYTSKKPPRFSISAIDVWDHMSNDTYPLKKKIKPGDVIIRFNINTEFDSEKAIKKQLRNAKIALMNKSREYGLFTTEKAKRLHDPVFLKLLRLLDLLLYKKLNPTLTIDNICDFLYGAAGWDIGEFNNDKKSAEAYLEKYLDMATIAK